MLNPYSHQRLHGEIHKAALCAMCNWILFNLSTNCTHIYECLCAQMGPGSLYVCHDAEKNVRYRFHPIQQTNTLFLRGNMTLFSFFFLCGRQKKGINFFLPRRFLFTASMITFVLVHFQNVRSSKAACSARWNMTINLWDLKAIFWMASIVCPLFELTNNFVRIQFARWN